MDKENTQINNFSHTLTMIERKTAVITGVKKIDNFDNEEFLLETVMGYLLIKGEDLELVKLDTRDGNVSIKGLIISYSYLEDHKEKDKENSIFHRLFKWFYPFKFTVSVSRWDSVYSFMGYWVFTRNWWQRPKRSWWASLVLSYLSI